MDFSFEVDDEDEVRDEKPASLHVIVGKVLSKHILLMCKVDDYDSFACLAL